MQNRFTERHRISHALCRRYFCILSVINKNRTFDVRLSNSIEYAKMMRLRKKKSQSSFKYQQSNAFSIFHIRSTYIFDYLTKLFKFSKVHSHIIHNNRIWWYYGTDWNLSVTFEFQFIDFKIAYDIYLQVIFSVHSLKGFMNIIWMLRGATVVSWSFMLWFRHSQRTWVCMKINFCTSV